MIINLASDLPGERDYLYEALADFTSGGPRERYAGWLEEKGDVARAATVRSTIAAYNEFDSSFLSNPAGTETWQRVIAIPMLECLIGDSRTEDQEELIALRDLVFPRIRPCLMLDYEPADSTPAVGTSYLWGRPDLPEDQAWPKIADVSDWFSVRDELPQELHCAFLGQVRFADLSEALLGRELPGSGGYTVFSITETNELGIHETVVRHWDPEQRLVRLEPPEDLIKDPLGDSCNSPKPPHTIKLTESISIPDATAPTFGDLIPGCKWNEQWGDLYRSMMAASNDETLGLGGYLRGTSGDDPSPDTNYLRFIVLRVTPEAGVVHFAIPNEDMGKGRLDRVQYVWTDWDG